MRNLFYTLICTVAIFSTFSCGNSEQEKLRQKQIEDSIAKVKADSIAKIEAMAKAKADSIAKAKADSLEKINNPHPDLKLFDLRGPVKSCKKGTNDYYRTLNFAESGELTLTGWNNGKYKIHRKNGKITELSYNKHDLITGHGYEFVTDNNGHIKQINSWDQDCSDKYTFQRNDNGLVTKMIHRNECAVDDIYFYTTTYTYQKFDSYGNWIKRTAKSEESGTNVETRTITYY